MLTAEIAFLGLGILDIRHSRLSDKTKKSSFAIVDKFSTAEKSKNKLAVTKIPVVLRWNDTPQVSALQL